MIKEELKKSGVLPLGIHPEIFESLDESKKKTISFLDSWDLSFVKDRLIDKYEWNSSDTEERVIEYKKFMSLFVLGKGPFGMTEPIDSVWHEHMLFSFDYMMLCNALVGAYIHHWPMGVKETRLRQEDDYEHNTRPTLEKNYGYVSKEVWPLRRPISQFAGNEQWASVDCNSGGDVAAEEKWAIVDCNSGGDVAAEIDFINGAHAYNYVLARKLSLGK